PGQGMSGWLSGLFGISRDDEEMEQLSFPAPETYGVDAIDAQVALYAFCKSERTASFCTERAIRSMLSMVIGDEIWRPKIDPKTKQAMGYANEVELMLVRQVFLTRSIVQVRSADSASGRSRTAHCKTEECRRCRKRQRRNRRFGHQSAGYFG